MCAWGVVLPQSLVCLSSSLRCVWLFSEIPPTIGTIGARLSGMGSSSQVVEESRKSLSRRQAPDMALRARGGRRPRLQKTDSRCGGPTHSTGGGAFQSLAVSERGARRRLRADITQPPRRTSHAALAFRKRGSEKSLPQRMARVRRRDFKSCRTGVVQRTPAVAQTEVWEVSAPSR